MAYDNTRENDWNWSQREAPRVPYDHHETHRRGISADKFPTPVASHNDMAWRQRADRHSMGCSQANRSQHPQLSQKNDFNSGTNCNNDVNNNFSQPPPQQPPPKRAAKRRFRHELPGPAGTWFQLQKQKNKRKTTVNSNNSGTTNNEKDANIEPDDVTSNQKQPTTQSKQQIQLFKDYSSKLHDCNAWNLMCTAHHRIIPTFEHFSSRTSDDSAVNTATQYKRLLSTLLPHQGLIHSIHSGKYDTHHISPSIHLHDLTLPTLFGYVSSITCHAHSDWTAVIVDESHACGEKGVTCWLEERLVKRYPSWVRPGVVWMLEGATLALFPSQCDADSPVDSQQNSSSPMDAPVENGTDISPSTEAARSGCAIDRMILAGEDSLVYAWTPEEASEKFVDGDFGGLLERRCWVVEEGNGKHNVMNGGLKTTQSDGRKVMKGSKIDGASMPSNDLNQYDKSTLVRKISPVVSRTDAAASRCDEANKVSDQQKNCQYESTTLDATIEREKLLSQSTSLANDRAREAPSQQQVSELQSASENKSHQNTVEQTALMHTSPVEKQADDRPNNSMVEKVNAPIVSTSPKQSMQPTTLLAKQTLSKSAAAAASCPSNTIRCGQTNPYIKSSTKNAPLSTINSATATTDKSSESLSINQEFTNNNPQNSTESTTPKSTNNMPCPPSGNSFDSFDIDDDELLAIPINALGQNSESYQAGRTLMSNPPKVNNTNAAAQNPSLDPKQNGTTPKQSEDEKIGSNNMPCPPSGNSFDSLDIDDDELLAIPINATGQNSKSYQAGGTKTNNPPTFNNKNVAAQTPSSGPKQNNATPKQSKSDQLKSNNMTCPPSGNSFDSLDIDDDELLAIPINAIGQNTHAHQAPTSSPKINSTSTLSPFNSNNSATTKESGSLKITNDATSKQSKEKNLGSTSKHCPPTADSLDDLDINDDELFHTNNNVKLDKLPQKHTTPDAEKPENHEPVTKSTTFGNIERAVLPCGPSIFDNIDNDDLDSLGDEEDF